jgi:RNase P subunit RPR2
MSFELVDDGTMDTVVACKECGETIRFDSQALMEAHRVCDEDVAEYRVRGAISDAESDHDCTEEAQ